MVWSPAVWRVAEYTGVDVWEVAHWPASVGWAHLAYMMWKDRSEKAAYNAASGDGNGTPKVPVDELEAKHMARAERNKADAKKRLRNGRASG